MKAHETIITLPYQDQKIAAKVWGDPKHLPVLALHGWLDNAASFDKIAPLLPNIYLIAIDLTGHGHSDHKPPGTFLHFIDLVIDTILVSRVLKLKNFALLGHSLGAALASFIAGTIPHQILGSALLDGLGPLTTPPQEAPLRLEKFIDEIAEKPRKNPPLYQNPEAAIKARLKGEHLLPESATILVNRGLKKINDRWTWRTDPRLLIPPALQLTEEQVLAFLARISSPTLIIRPKEGYPFPSEMVQCRLHTLQHITVQEVEGRHHVHLDDPEETAHYLVPFFNTLALTREALT